MYSIDVNPCNRTSNRSRIDALGSFLARVQPGGVDFLLHNQGSEACQYMQFGGLVRNLACASSRVVWTHQRLRQSGAEGPGKLVHANVRRSGGWQQSADESGPGGVRRCRFSFNHNQKPRSVTPLAGYEES